MMDWIQLLFLGHIISLFSKTINCVDQQMDYHLWPVKNISEPLVHEKDTFEIDENNVVDIANTNKLSEANRIDICKQAVKEVNNKTENVNFQFKEDGTTGRMKAYQLERVEAPPLTQPKLILACKCPTWPSIYIQIHNRTSRGSSTSIVTIIVRQSDLKTIVLCTKDACYDVKLVEDILLVPWPEVEKYKNGLIKYMYDTNKFTEEQRMDMCRKALDVDDFKDRNFKFLEDIHTTGVKRLYYLILDAKNPKISREATLAFRCPIAPAIYLEVRETKTTNDQNFWVTVIVSGFELPPTFHEIEFQYQLKVVLSISETAINTPSKRGQFYKLFEPLLYPNKINQIDPTRLNEEQRHYMCKQAFQAVHEEIQQSLHFLEEANPGKCEYHRINFQLSKMREVQVFKCPTYPPTYLSIGEQGIAHNVWVLIEESEETDIFTKLQITQYQMKLVESIGEVPIHRINEVLRPEDVKLSAVDPDMLGKEKRGQLCKKAVQVVSGIKIKYFGEIATEMSRYYMMQTESVESDIFQAYKCPTNPETFLHITKGENDENILWIIMKESETLPMLDFLGYQIKLYKEVTPVESTDLVQEQSISHVKRSAIRSRKFHEMKRHQMCKTAMEIISNSSTNVILEDTRTGEERYYTVSTESEEGENDVAVLQAFQCPTRPPLYLHISKEDGGFIVWIVMKESIRILDVNELRYDIKVTKDIMEVSQSLSELRKEGRGKVKKSAIDTDNKLTEQQRQQMCVDAQNSIQEINIFEFLYNVHTRKKEFYSVTSVSGSEAFPCTFIQAFQCPVKPAIFLHVHEDRYGFTVWVIYKEPLPMVINDMNYKVKIVKKVTELLPKELEKEPFGSIEKMVVDTDKLTEGERQQLCLKVLDSVPDMNIVFQHNKTPGMKGYYAVEEDNGLGSKEVPYLHSVVQAFQCPTKPAIFICINYRKDGNGYEAQVTIEERKPLPDVNSLFYNFKMIDKIYSVPPAELSANFAEIKRNTHSVDANEFPREYRRQLCERAVELITEEYVEISKIQDTGRCYYYYYHLVELKDPNIVADKEKIAYAFKCPTYPAIYIEVIEMDEKYFTWVFIKETEVIDEGDDICYLVEFVRSVTQVSSSKPGAAIASGVEVDTDQFKEKKRSLMCEDAMEQQALADMEIRTTSDSTIPNRFLKHSYLVELFSGEQYEMQAFGCSTQPPIYLQIRCWRFKCRIVSIVVEKKEIEESDKHEKDLEEQSRGSRKSEESMIILKKADSFKQRGLRRSNEFIVFEETDLYEQRGSRQTQELIQEFEYTVDQRGSRPESDTANTSNVVHDKKPLQPTKIIYIESIRLAIEDEIFLMTPARKETLMIDTDMQYSEDDRIKMCHKAIQFVQLESEVNFSNKKETGHSQFYVIEERLLDRFSKEQIVRAYECPTDPPLYLAVRYHKERGFTLTILVVAEKTDFSMNFYIKLAYTMTKRLTHAPKEKPVFDDEIFPEAKRLQMCRRSARLIKKVMDTPIKLLENDFVGNIRTYIRDAGMQGFEEFLAFKCPTQPATYLQLSSPQVGHIDVFIIILTNASASNSESSIDSSESILSNIDIGKIEFIHKPVTDIEEVEDSVVDGDRFSETELELLCLKAMEIFPDGEFDFEDDGYPEPSKRYILNPESKNPEIVTAFNCRTTPSIFIQFEKVEEDEYRAWCITVEPKSTSVSRTSSGTVVDNLQYRLLPVIYIKDATDVTTMYDMDDSPPARVRYTEDQRREMCKNGSKRVEAVAKFMYPLDCKPSDDCSYIVKYSTELGLQKKRLTAFQCRTNPPIYIHLQWDDELNSDVANVLFERLFLKVEHS